MEENSVGDEVTNTTTETVSEKKYTINEAIEHCGFGRFQVLMLFVTGLYWTADAMEVFLISFVTPILTEEWDLNAVAPFMVSSSFLGAFLGAFIWGQLSDRIGRKRTMVINIIFTSFFGFISAFSPEWISFMITRGLTGLGVVGGHVPFSLFSEFLPTRFRGVFLIFINAFWCVGGASSAGLAWAILPAETIASIRAWRWYLGISSIPYMLLILIVWLAPESPRYLYVSKRYEETEQVLQKVVRWNGKAPLEGRLATDEVDEKPQTRANFFLLFSKQFIRTTIPLFGVWFLMAFAYYGVIVMTPDYFKAHASSQDEPYIATFITSAAELPGTFVAAALINRIGRKYTQITMLAVCGVFMLLLMIPTYLWLLTIFAIVCRISVSGAFGTTFVFTPETYPTIVRSTAMGSCTSVSRLGGVLTPLVATALFKINAWIPIIIYAVSCLLGCVSTFLVPVETSGKGLVDTAVTSPPPKVTTAFVELQEDTTQETV